MIFRKLIVISTFLVMAACAFVLVSNAGAVEKYDWTKKKKDDWKLTEITSEEIAAVVRFKSASSGYGNKGKHDKIPTGYYTQGGVVTENYYVFSVFKGDAAKNYIYVANRSDGKIVKTFKATKWGHMNSFYYDWGSGQVRILNMQNYHRTNADKDGCLDLNTLTLSSDGKGCASKRSKDYGAQGLVGQGEATADGYVYTLGWDGGTKHTSAQYTWERHSNVLFIYDKSTKKLVKSLYIPKDVVNGEVEDISIDGNGDVYLLYNQTSKDAGHNGIAFYKISAATVGTTKDKTAPGYTSDDNDSDTEEEKSEPEEKNSNNCSTSILSDSYCNQSESGNSGGGNLDSIAGILELAITILSGGVGIGGLAGIVWAGIIIMTSRDDAARLALGKKRLLEIVVGLALYAVAAGVILWLIPG